MNEQALDIDIDLGMSDLAEGIETSQQGQLTMDTRLSGENVEMLISDILAFRFKDLNVDASAVEHADTPCVEALIAAAKQWALDGFSLKFTSVSENFASALSTLGLDQTDLEAGELK